MDNRHSFFTGKALFWGLGISLILNLANTNFWISEIIGILIGGVILLLVKKVNHNKFTKAISGFSMSFITGSLLVNMASTLYLRESPVIFLTLFSVVGAFIISRSREKSLKKTLTILFVYAVVVSLTSSLCLLGEAKFENLLPAFYYDFKGVILGALVYVLTTITPILTLNDLSDKKSIMINYAMSSLFILVESLLIVTVLGNKEAMLYRYPEYGVLKRIKISEFFTNVDNIFVVPLVVDLMISLALGFRNIQVEGKITKFIAPFILILCIFMACLSSSVMTTMYNFYPFLLVFLLIVTLVPKS